MTGPLRRRARASGAALVLAATCVLALSPATAPASSGADATTTTSATTTTTVATTTTTTTPRPVTPLPWPDQGTAAVAVPQASVAAASPRHNVRPIASLTKMMTAWVILHHLHLALGQRGPCTTVTAHDVAVYDYDLSIGESSAKVAAGERLCANALMTGLLVHSAGNFAYVMLRMLGLGTQRFVAEMNADAAALGLTRTHYVDITGIRPGDRSTALDQATLAADLMAYSPVVRAAVRRPSVRLPVAGVLVSYTPLVGTNHVVGVKSGYTIPAGGCDAMAVRFMIDGVAVTTYAVVLGFQGGDVLTRAGEAALALTRALRPFLAVRTTSRGRVVVWTGQPGDVVTTTTTTTTTTTVPATTTSAP